MFSVIIPVYNAEKTIEKTLNSLAGQTRMDWIEEVIIVDDGSTDETAKLVKTYQRRGSGKNNEAKLPIKYIYQKNAGPSSARNTGMQQATGEYIAFVDADDEWQLDKLEKQGEILKKYVQIDLLCGGLEEGALRILNRTYDTLCHISLKDYCIKSIIFTSTVVIKRERAKEAGEFNENMRYAEDMNYYQRFFRWDQVYYLPEKLVSYGSGREYYGQNGLSSHLKEMHEGRQYNYGILRKEGQISSLFYILMIIFGEIKYFRRRCLTNRERRRYHNI